MKPSRLLALATCAFAFWATSCPAAGESISVNVTYSGSYAISGSEGNSGYESVANANWTDISSSSNAINVSGLKLNDGSSSPVTMTATSGGSWSYNSTEAFGAMGRGYADGEWTIQLANIPFSSYEVILYMATDWSSRWGAVGVQLAEEESPTYYAYPLVNIDAVAPLEGDAIYASSDAEETATWGKSMPSTHGYGVDVMRIGNLSGSSITLTTKNHSGTNGYATSVRCGLYGFQIVNTGDLITGTTYTASPSGTEVTFGSIAWAEGTLTAGTFNEATLTLEPGTTLTLDAAVPTLNKLTLVSTGKVTLAVSGEGVTLDTALANVANFDFTGVTELDIGALTANAMTIPAGATLTMNAPGQVTTLTQNGKVKYAGGEALTLFDIHTAAQANKTTLIDKTISSVKTSSPSNRDLEGYFAINGSRTIELGENADITVSTRFAMADDGGASPVLNQNGGTITVTSEGTTNTSTTGTAAIFGHWSGTPAYNLNKGTLSVANGAILLGWSGNPTMTVGTSDGEAESAKVITKGIVSHGASDQAQNGKLVLNPSGVIEVGSLGLDFSNTCKTGAVVELAGGLLKVTDTAPLALANQSGLQLTADTTISVDSGKTLTVSTPFTGTGALTLTGGGTVDLSALGKNLPKIASLAEGTTLRVAPISQSERLTGNFSASLPLADGATLSGTIEYLDGETWKTATVTTDGSTASLSGSLSTDATLTGSSWWWDYEFDGALSNSGRDGTALSGDTQGTSYNDGNTALMLKSTPYRGVTGGYPAAVTAVFYGTAGTTPHGGILAFGTKSGGAISLVGGDDPEAGQMRLIYSVNTTVTELVSQEVMNVPNATTANHLYAFTKRSEAGKTIVDIYLDGKVLTKYTFDSEVSLGAGFQVGSLHGGTITDQIVKCADDAGTVDFLRVADEALTPAAIKAMATAYPYVSAKGTASRTVSEATA
ncbi:MAG: hypothetical protein ACI4W7_06945, partial [Candidatus Spyradenecus sp.]